MLELNLGYACMCVCFYVWVCVWVSVCENGIWVGVSMEDIRYSAQLPFSLERMSFDDHEAKLPATKPSDAPISTLPSAVIIGMWVAMTSFLHRCWRFDLRFSCFCSKCSYPFSPFPFPPSGISFKSRFCGSNSCPLAWVVNTLLTEIISQPHIVFEDYIPVVRFCSRVT